MKIIDAAAHFEHAVKKSNEFHGFRKLTRNKFGEEAFDALLRFAENVKNYVSKVVLTTVETTITEEEQEQCLAICDRIGVTYRIRPWED